MTQEVAAAISAHICCNDHPPIDPVKVVGPSGMVALQWPLSCFLCLAVTRALRYDPSELEYNINTNQTANDPRTYWGEWQNHTFNPSPSNWRFPFYTVLLDRFANGNPNNDDANGTQYEHDLTQTQLRHGGDVQGLQDSLDYLQGMGIKVGLAAESLFCSYELGPSAWQPRLRGFPPREVPSWYSKKKGSTAS